MLYHADMVVIHLICSAGIELRRLMDIDLPVDADDQIGFAVDKAEVVGNGEYRHFAPQPCERGVELLLCAGVDVGSRFIE